MLTQVEDQLKHPNTGAKRNPPKISKSEILIKYFEGNLVLGLIMRIKVQTKAKICTMNCKYCVAEKTCCLCSKLDYELVTCLLNKFWNTQFCCTKVQIMKDKILQELHKIEDAQSKAGKHREGCRSKQ